MSKKTLHVKITSPSETIWEGKAKAVSSENTDGKFDILYGHANFVTLISKKPIIVRTETGEHAYTFDRAVIRAQNNEVSIYTELVHKRE